MKNYFLTLPLLAASALSLAPSAFAQATVDPSIYQRDFARAQAVAVPQNERPKKIIVADALIGPNSADASIMKGALQMFANMGTNTVLLSRFGAIENQIPTLAQQLGLNQTWRAVYQPYNGRTKAPGYLSWNDEVTTPDKVAGFQHEQGDLLQKTGYVGQNIAVFHIADEPGFWYPKIYGQMVETPARLTLFQNWLQGKGLQPRDVGATSWQGVRPIGRGQSNDLSSRRLYYWSARYTTEAASQGLHDWTQALQTQFGPQIKTASNWNNVGNRWITPTPNQKYGNNTDAGPDAALGAIDWMDAGRARAVTAFWSEDWFDDKSAPSWSLIADTLRAATYEANRQQFANGIAPTGGSGAEFGGYVVGRKIDGVAGARLKALSLVGHGAKILHWYTYGPHGLFGDGYSDNPQAIEGIASANRLIGRAEDLLYPGRRPASKLAILLPTSAYAWDEAAGGPLYWFEIRGLHSALVNAGYAVDFLDETNVANGDLANRGYQMIYVTAPNISAAAQTQLNTWMQNGGTAVLGPGAATFDEYNTPTNVLDAARGARSGVPERWIQNSGLAERHSIVFSGQDWGGNTTVARPIVPLQVQDATVEATENGQAVLTRHRLGKGLCVSYGFWAGARYFDAAQPGYSSLVRGIDPKITQMITAAPRLTRLPKQVLVDTENVETSRLESAAGIAVSLCNWSKAPLNQIEVTVPNAGQITSVGSAESGRLQFTRDGDSLRVKMPLRDADVLMLRR